jgi:hypothetical protein
MLLYVDQSGCLIWQVGERTRLVFSHADPEILESLVDLRNYLTGSCMTKKRFLFTGKFDSNQTSIIFGSLTIEPAEVGVQVTRRDVKMYFDGKRRTISSDKNRFLAEMNRVLAELVGFNENRSSTRHLRKWNGAMESNFLKSARRLLKKV